MTRRPWSSDESSKRHRRQSTRHETRDARNWTNRPRIVISYREFQSALYTRRYSATYKYMSFFFVTWIDVGILVVIIRTIAGAFCGELFLFFIFLRMYIVESVFDERMKGARTRRRTAQPFVQCSWRMDWYFSMDAEKSRMDIVTSAFATELSGWTRGEGSFAPTSLTDGECTWRKDNRCVPATSDCETRSIIRRADSGEGRVSCHSPQSIQCKSLYHSNKKVDIFSICLNGPASGVTIGATVKRSFALFRVIFIMFFFFFCLHGYLKMRMRVTSSMGAEEYTGGSKIKDVSGDGRAPCWRRAQDKRDDENRTRGASGPLANNPEPCNFVNGQCQCLHRRGESEPGVTCFGIVSLQHYPLKNKVKNTCQWHIRNARLSHRNVTFVVGSELFRA